MSLDLQLSLINDQNYCLLNINLFSWILIDYRQIFSGAAYRSIDRLIAVLVTTTDCLKPLKIESKKYSDFTWYFLTFLVIYRGCLNCKPKFDIRDFPSFFKLARKDFFQEISYHLHIQKCSILHLLSNGIWNILLSLITKKLLPRYIRVFDLQALYIA